MTMYKWKGDLLAKYLLFVLVLVLALNCVLITGLQLLLSYPLRSHAEALEPYSSYNVIDTTGSPPLMATLLAAPATENRLIVTENHFLAPRCRVVLDTEVDRHDSADFRTDHGKVHVHLDGISKIGGFSFRNVSLPIRFGAVSLRIPANFLLWNLLLLTFEILAAVLFHKLRTK